jgi:hypothetical protein
MADQEQQLPKQLSHHHQQQHDQPLDLQQQVLQIQEVRRQRQHQNQELNDDTVRLLDNLRQVHQQKSESWRQHLQAVLCTQDLILMLAPDTQLSAGTLAVFKFCKNYICRLCASGFNVTYVVYFRIQIRIQKRSHQLRVLR